jgi:hypothetical protein
MMTGGKVRVELRTCLTATLDGDGKSASRPNLFIPWEIASGTHWEGGWAGPSAHLQKGQNTLFLLRIEERFIDLPVRIAIANVASFFLFFFLSFFLPFFLSFFLSFFLHVGPI